MVASTASPRQNNPLKNPRNCGNRKLFLRRFVLTDKGSQRATASIGCELSKYYAILLQRARINGCSWLLQLGYAHQNRVATNPHVSWLAHAAVLVNKGTRTQCRHRDRVRMNGNEANVSIATNALRSVKFQAQIHARINSQLTLFEVERRK